MGRHLTLIVVYTLIAVPWYWGLLPEAWSMQRVYGLPMWVVVSVAGSFGVSLHSCLIFCRPWAVENETNDASKPASQQERRSS